MDRKKKKHILTKEERERHEIVVMYGLMAIHFPKAEERLAELKAEKRREMELKA